ncbi:MAG: hypothetical protein ABIR80_05645, partial [Opitutaceae bacterium]
RHPPHAFPSSCTVPDGGVGTLRLFRVAGRLRRQSSGLGRSYVKLDGKLDYDAWCEGIRLGRNYVSDSRSHLMITRTRGKSIESG